MYDSWVGNTKWTIEFKLVCVLQKCFSNAVYYILIQKEEKRLNPVKRGQRTTSTLDNCTQHTWNKLTSLIFLKSSSQSISCCISQQKLLWKSIIWETFSAKEWTCNSQRTIINCHKLSGLVEWKETVCKEEKLPPLLVEIFHVLKAPSIVLIMSARPE
jgi:hypothetical protein